MQIHNPRNMAESCHLDSKRHSRHVSILIQIVTRFTSFPSSFESLLVGFVCNVGIHKSRDIVDLLVLSPLQKLSITVSIFQSNCVSHCKGHKRLIEDEHSFFTQNLEFTQWD